MLEKVNKLTHIFKHCLREMYNRNLQHIVAEEQVVDLQLKLSQECSLKLGPILALFTDLASADCTLLLSNFKSRHTCLGHLSKCKWHRTIFQPHHTFISSTTNVYFHTHLRVKIQEIFIISHA